MTFVITVINIERYIFNHEDVPFIIRYKSMGYVFGKRKT